MHMMIKYFVSGKSNKEEFISVLIYILQSNADIITANELENILSCTQRCLDGLFTIDLIENIMKLLQQIDREKFIIIDKYKINVNDKWLCKLIILSSMKSITRKKLKHVQSIDLLRQAINTFTPHRFESCHLLRLIVLILNNMDKKLDPNISFKLLYFSKLVALSPLYIAKQSSEDISKIALKHLTLTDLSNLKYLPIKGIPTSHLQHVFKFDDPAFIRKTIIRIIEMFANNIENREGGALYKILLDNLDFETWRNVVWPIIYQRFQQLDYEGEFFQSLLKYWIPLTVNHYKIHFHHFIETTDISYTLKGYILLDTKRRSFLKTYNEQDVIFIEKLFSTARTNTLALKIVACHDKGAPMDVELYFVYKFLQIVDILSTEQHQYLKRILKSVAKAAAETKAQFYLDFLTNVHRLGFKLLKTDRRFIGAQILLDCPDECIQMEYIETRLGDYKNYVHQAFLNSDGSGIFGQLVKKFTKNTEYFSENVIRTYIEKSKDILSIQAAESVATVFQLAAHFNSRKTNDEIQVSAHISLRILFEKYKNNKADIRDVFEIAFLLKGLVQLLEVRIEIVDDIFEEFYPAAVDKLLDRADASMNKSTLFSEHFPNGKLKYEKVLEELYANICQLLRNHRHIYGKKCLDIVSFLVQVIQYSSMRRPTTLSGDLLREFATDDLRLEKSFTEKTDLLNYKIKLLNETLQQLELSSSVQSLTIRKNPETRLVLHSLCLGDFNPQKYFLRWTMTHLLELLEDAQSENASVAAAIHCTEALMSDNSFYEHTLKYAPQVIMTCVRHFANRNWVVRNACVNLAKALIDRFFGVVTGTNNRAKCMDDLFQIFPQIVAPFLRIIFSKSLDDSALAVMLFFSESQIKSSPFVTEFSIATREAFLLAFVQLVKNDAGLYGNFAVRAYVSLCLEEDIPQVLGHVVDFCMGNFTSIRSTGTTRNFVLLVKELYDKYADYIREDVDKPHGSHKIHEYLQEFCRFLQQFDSRQFDCLLLNIWQEEHVVAQLQKNVNINSYEVRLQLHNYVPYIVIHSDPNNLSKILNTVLSQQLPAFIQVKVLSILVDRFAKHGFGQYTSDILLVLFSQALITDDNHLLFCYYKVILLLMESSKAISIDFNQIVAKIRPKYNKIQNIYKLFICFVILSFVPIKTESDKAFIKSSIDSLKNLELTEDVSTMLKYVYKNTDTPCDKIEIFKLCLKLLSDHGHWHFVTFITNSSSFSASSALKKILEFKLLKEIIQDDCLILKFVRGVHLQHHCFHNDVVNVSETYYAEENSLHVSSYCLNNFVIKFLHGFLFYLKGVDWRLYYDQLWKDVQNKRIGF